MQQNNVRITLVRTFYIGRYFYDFEQFQAAKIYKKLHGKFEYHRNGHYDKPRKAVRKYSQMSCKP